MDGFDEGNILIEKYFPHIKPEILTLDEWALSMAKVKFLQEQEMQLLSLAISKVFSDE